MTDPTPEQLAEMGAWQLWLCESASLVLHPNRLYYFTVHPDCDECKRLAAMNVPPIRAVAVSDAAQDR